jgi:ferrochelatase
MKRGVLLFNLGGPDSLDDVRPFLYNLFSDPEIIRIKSNTLRRTLAWFIATVRQGKSRNLYRQIGGGSPLRRITEAQAAALSDALGSINCRTNVYIGMRCWKPSIEDAVDRILKDQIAQLVLLPLFPQYSVTTTGSCLKYFQALDQRRGLSSKIKISAIESWFMEPSYLDCMVDLIREELPKFSGRGTKPVHLLYSAHSIPASYIDKGDPYLEQIRQTVTLINERLANAYAFTLAFQSKVGPVKWLSPSTEAILRELGQKGTTAVLTIPVSFVSDHIETLQEIDIAYRDIARDAGIAEFRRVPALNTDPRFISALADLVTNAFEKS